MNERERIELLMKCYDLSASQFADRTGIQRASVSHILSGRNKPSLEVMLKIYEAFPGLDMKWLMTGVGEEPVAPMGTSGHSGGLFGDVVAADSNSEMLSASVVNVLSSETAVKKARQQQEKARQTDNVEKRRSAQSRQAAQSCDMPRRIKEVRIFYTDGTYETLVPER